MAQEAKTFQFNRPRGARVSKYPWDMWLNGKVWALDIGEDFTAAVESFRNNATSAAKTRKGKVQIEVKDNKLYMQFYTD